MTARSTSTWSITPSTSNSTPVVTSLPHAFHVPTSISWRPTADNIDDVLQITFKVSSSRRYRQWHSTPSPPLPDIPLCSTPLEVGGSSEVPFSSLSSSVRHRHHYARENSRIFSANNSPSRLVPTRRRPSKASRGPLPARATTATT